MIFQSRPNQFFLLMPELEVKNPEDVVARIRGEWEKTDHGKDFRLEYAVEQLDYRKEVENERDA